MISKIYTNPVFKPSSRESYRQTHTAGYNYAIPDNKTPFNSVSKDVFQLQNKLDPSFKGTFKGVIPKEDVFRCIYVFTKEIRDIHDIDGLKNVAKNFSEILRKTLHIDSKLVEFTEGGVDMLKEISENPSLKDTKFDDRESELIYEGYVNDLSNNILFKLANIGLYSEKNPDSIKTEIGGVIKYAKLCTRKWENFDKWAKNTDLKHQSKHIFEILLDELEPFAARTHADFVAETLYGMKTYGNNKLINVAIREGFQDESSAYYCAYFTNSNSKQISHEELKKIFSRLIKLLQENGFQSDIPNLIQKEGSCLCVPLM